LFLLEMIQQFYFIFVNKLDEKMSKELDSESSQKKADDDVVIFAGP
jgi:hypothetical protein